MASLCVIGCHAVLSCISIDVKVFLSTHLTLDWVCILGEQDISGNIQFLYLPGGIMNLVVLATCLLNRMQFPVFRAALKESTHTVLGAGFVLVFTIPMVRILINSDVNLENLPAMPQVMAQLVAGTLGDIYPFFAPTVGALGAFIAGSDSVSNLMLAQLQFDTAQLIEVSGGLLVAAQAVGAVAGNMIAIHNVVAASATVGLLGREGSIIRMNSIPTLYYLFTAGVITLAAVH